MAGERLRCAIAIVFLAGCRGPSEPHAGAYQGVIEYDTRAIAAEIGGRLAEVSLTRGGAVTAGAIAARFEPGLAQAVRAARASEVEVARAQLALVLAGSRREELDAALAQIRAARAAEGLTRTELARAQRLADQQATPRSVVDQLAGQLERATAERQALEERYQGLRHGARGEERAAAEARVAAAEAVLAVEDRRLAQLELRAPIGGVVLEILRRAGEVALPGTPIAIVADLAHPFVDVFVPEAELAAIALGQPARIVTDGEVAASGAVEHIAARAEFTPKFLFSERERANLVLRVRIRIEDPERQLHAGVPAFVSFARAPR